MRTGHPSPSWLVLSAAQKGIGAAVARTMPPESVQNRWAKEKLLGWEHLVSLRTRDNTGVCLGCCRLSLLI